MTEFQPSAIDPPERSKKPSLPLAGKSVYSAGVIAVYTALTNIPVGCILLGLNLQARGSTGVGRLAIASGAAGAAGLCAIVLFGTGSRSVGWIGVVAAVFIYRFEKAPVAAAIRGGATLARWWPPALWIAGGFVLLLAVASLLP